MEFKQLFKLLSPLAVLSPVVKLFKPFTLYTLELTSIFNFLIFLGVSAF